MNMKTAATAARLAKTRRKIIFTGKDLLKISRICLTRGYGPKKNRNGQLRDKPGQAAVIRPEAI